MLRNLLYNCCPLKGAEEVLRDNIERLCLYDSFKPSIFNHRKIVIIKTGNELEDPDVVAPLFASLGDVEFVLWPNDQKLQETAGFIEALGMLESTRKDEITFYAHTKGVGKAIHLNIPNDVVNIQEKHLVAVRQWRNRMYHECLNNVKRIDKVLQKHPACGCFFRLNPRRKNVWMFSGTFWWVNHQRLFSKNWKKIEQIRGGVEYYLSGLFTFKEAYELYSSNSPRLLFDVFRYYACPCGKDLATTQKTVNCPKCGKPLVWGGLFADMRYD